PTEPQPLPQATRRHRLPDIDLVMLQRSDDGRIALKVQQAGDRQRLMVVLCMDADQLRRIAVSEELFERELEVDAGRYRKSTCGCDQIVECVLTEMLSYRGFGNASGSTAAAKRDHIRSYRAVTPRVKIPAGFFLSCRRVIRPPLIVVTFPGLEV